MNLLVSKDPVSAELNRPARRDAGIDIARGLGIVLVVLGHNWISVHDGGALYRTIFSFHMPLFFFISGMVIDATAPAGRFLVSRAESLLKPFLVVLIVVGVAKVATGSAQALPYVAGLAYATGITIAWGALWFLPHLFISLGVVDALLRSGVGQRGDAWRLALAVLLFVAGLACLPMFWRVEPGDLLGFDMRTIGRDHLPGLPWSLDLVGITAAFALLGCEWRRRGLQVGWPAMLVSIVGLGLLQATLPGTIDLNHRRFDHPVVCTAEALLGIAAVLGLARLLARVSWARVVVGHLGRASLLILLFHYAVQDRVFKLAAARAGEGWLAVTTSLVAGIAVPVAIGAVVARSRWLAMLFLPRRRAPRAAVVVVPLQGAANA